jgi:exosortase A-associated hydrolase 1
MRWSEEALVFDCAGEALVGVLCLPATDVRAGLVIVVGGPQYRAGSHRQFVLLSRRLADAGVASLRFDCRGMGDSTGARRSFEIIGADIGAAIDALADRLPGLDAVFLFGLCDGASAALLYWHATRDARVRGLCLANPWVRSETSQARTALKHYYARRLLERSFWAKLVRGRVALSAARELLQSVRRLRLRASGTGTLRFQDRMAEAWRSFDGRLLLLLSGDDYTAREFLEFVRSDPRWRAALEHPRLERHDLAQADHTFSRAAECAKMQALTLDWLARCAAPLRAGSPAPRSLAPVE